MAVILQVKRGNASNWTSENPTLEEGEIGLEKDTYKIKIGDGATSWNSLAYFASGGGSSISSGSTSGTNTYTSALSPALSSLTTFQTVQVKIGSTSNGASTFNPNSLGAKKIYKNISNQAISGDLVANTIYTMIYDGTLDTGAGGWLIVDSVKNARNGLSLTQNYVELGGELNKDTIIDGINNHSLTLSQFTSFSATADQFATITGNDQAELGVYLNRALVSLTTDQVDISTVSISVLNDVGDGTSEISMASANDPENCNIILNTTGTLELNFNELQLNGNPATNSDDYFAGDGTWKSIPSGGSGTVTSVGLALGTSGSDIGVSGSPITSSGSITLNIPTASASNRGALSSTDWSTFNNKASTSSPTFTGTVNAAAVTLTGLLITRAGVTGGPSLRIPHGVAPTSPTNGDVWTTTTDFLVRLNGTTVALAKASRTINGYNLSNDITLQPNDLLPTVQSTASASTVTATASDNIVVITAQAAGLTLANPTGTWSQGQVLVYRIKDNGTSRTISYGGNFRAMGVVLPTATVISKTLYITTIYNSTDTKHDVVGVNLEA